MAVARLEGKAKGLPLAVTADTELRARATLRAASASVSGFPLCTGSVLMSAHDGAVNETHFPVDGAGRIGLGVAVRQDTLPDANLLPAPEAVADGRPPPITLGHIALGRSGAQNPPNPIDDGAVIMGRSAGRWLLGGQQGCQPVSFVVG